MLTLVIKIALIAAILYALILFGAVVVQRKLMYFPARERVEPSRIGLAAVEERVISTPDGARVIAWYGKAQPGQPTILYFHGNGGSLITRQERIRKYLDRGRGILMMTYRGYGGSTGTPSEKANVADARLAYDLLRKDGIAPADIIIYGESLGSGVAVQVAAVRDCAGLVLDAPYTSVVDVGSLAYPFLPVDLLLTDRYETMRYIGGVRVPLLVIHGERDTVIPVEMGRAVHAAANEPKTLVTFRQAGHSDHHQHGSFEAVNDWIDRLKGMAQGDSADEGRSEQDRRRGAK